MDKTDPPTSKSVLAMAHNVPPTILVIEDEPNIRDALRFILSREGFVVHVHENGETAADVVRDRAPDAIVLDVMLPSRSGFDILSDLRADKGTADVPVLMLTARGQDTDRETALHLGASAFMTKPFSNDAVVEAVRALLPPHMRGVS